MGELVTFVSGAIIGGLIVYFVLRKNPKLLGSIEWLQGKIDAVKKAV